MAIRTGQGTQISFDRAFESVEQLAQSCKTISQNLNTKSLAGTLTGDNVIRYFQDIGTNREQLNAWGARFTDVPAANAYAQDRYNDATYLAATEFTALITALDNVLTFISVNIPTDLLTWDAVNGDVTWNVFTAAQTATLRTQLQSIIDVVD